MRLQTSEGLSKEEAYREAVKMFYKKAQKVEEKSIKIKETESAEIIRKLEEAKENQIENAEIQSTHFKDEEISYPAKPYTEKFLKEEQEEILDSAAYTREKNQK